MRSACQAPRSATSVPSAPCNGCACTWAWSSSTRASASSSEADGDRAGGAAARPPRAGRSGSAARTAAGARRWRGGGSGPGSRPGPSRTIVRCWVSASTRLPDRPRSCFSTTARPPRLRRHHDVTGPELVEAAGLRGVHGAAGLVERRRAASGTPRCRRSGDLGRRRAPAELAPGCARGAG